MTHDCNTRIDPNIEAFRELFVDIAVTDAERLQRYHSNCIGLVRSIPLVLSPKSEEDVIQIVKASKKQSVPLYPVSKGNNWGYGAANPIVDGCVLLDLSEMNRVLDVDEELATVTVEPGVTTGQLDEMLSVLGSDLMVPVTGAGPNGSLVGNALERGYGIAPNCDHFEAVLSVRAVLPDGTVYQGFLADAGGERINRIYKWGVGPYIDGLFAQGNFGIVTEMTIGLRRRPDRVEMVVFSLNDVENLGSVIGEMRSILQLYPGAISGFNLMNKHRIYSMVPASSRPNLELNLQSRKSRLIESFFNPEIPEWTGVGAVFAGKALSKSFRRQIKKRLQPFCQDVRFVDKKKVRLLQYLLTVLPKSLRTVIKSRLTMLDEALDIFSGHPKTTALKLAYLKNDPNNTTGPDLDPASDGCGLIWYAPLIPMLGKDVEKYVQLVEKCCVKYGFEPLITLTTITSRAFDSSVPIIYSRENEVERAEECFRELLNEGQKLGYLPYRMNAKFMKSYTDLSSSSHNDLVSILKSAVDTENLFAPGRYCR